jgi:hypothetical protein
MSYAPRPPARTPLHLLSRETGEKAGKKSASDDQNSENNFPGPAAPRAGAIGNPSMKCPEIGHPHPAASTILAGRCGTSLGLLQAASQNELRAIISPAWPTIERLAAACWLGEESCD